jgi:hypothetical protein
MALTFTTTQAGASADYIKYLYAQPVVRLDKVNEPTVLDFSLVPWNASFVKLTRGAYITFNTATFPNWFTGYVTNDPQLEYLGTAHNAPVYGYKYEATDDSYILNLKPLGLVAPYLNSFSGNILKDLVGILDPDAAFDVTNIGQGVMFARYVVDPNKRFSDVVKELSDASAYKFRANSLKLYFDQKDSVAATITIDATNKHHQAGKLIVTPSKDPIVNDVTVVGSVEPQNYIHEYMVGDGFTAAWPLLSGVFGADSTKIISEDFGGQIDTTVWDVFDNANNWLQPINGYLNVLGGSVNGSFDIYISSAKVLPMEGQLRLTHGQYDFLASGGNNVNGVVGGLWTQAPNSSYTGCLYGIQVLKTAGVITLNPIVNGTVDGTQTVTVNTAHRYIMRTLNSFTAHMRQRSKYQFLKSNGVVGFYGGDSDAGVVSYNTWIVEIDPATGNVVSTTQWVNPNTSVASGATYANYIPVASNDLHCTVTGISVSSPMQAYLEIKPNGGGGYITKILGPNEIDSLDGLAPIATITNLNSNQGGSTSSRNNTGLGTPKYNLGDSTLQFFKDTTKQVTTTPQVGDLLHLVYRRANFAVGRVRDLTSVITESNAWGDNGIRTLVKLDVTPLPRISLEAEAAAAALIQEYGFQHYEGTYTQNNTFQFTGHPISGTILNFQNMGTSFPTGLLSEVLTQVKTTFISARPSEVFEHEITFGKRDRVGRLLRKLNGLSPNDIIGVIDTVDAPDYIHLTSIGLVNVADVTNPSLVSLSSSNLNFNTNQAAPSGGGFEIRYTDDSWGADASRNLVTRVSTQTFSVPRNARGKICFVKAYDARNRTLYSEDLTQASWVKTNATVTNSMMANPDGAKALISSVAITVAAGSVYHQTATAAASNQAVGSISIKGTAGKQVNLVLADGAGTVLATTAITLTNRWVRYSVTGTFGSGASGNIRLYLNSVSGSGTHTFQASWASVETGTGVETQYFKTNGTEFGAMSRYAAGLRVNYPLVPPAPTATVTFADPVNPAIAIVLPTSLQDVWGVEIRASNNTTVLYHQDLTASGYTPTFTAAGNASRSLSYFIYTYNLLGEYCATPFNLTATIPTPSLSGLSVDETTGKLIWTGSNAAFYKVEVATDSGYTSILINKTVTEQAFPLDDENMLRQRYFRVTPQDTLGNGTAVTASHAHTPAGVVDALGGGAVNNTDNTYSVPFPPTPTTTITPPSSFTPWSDQITQISNDQYIRSFGKRY